MSGFGWDWSTIGSFSGPSGRQGECWVGFFGSGNLGDVLAPLETVSETTSPKAHSTLFKLVTRQAKGYSPWN